MQESIFKERKLNSGIDTAQSGVHFARTIMYKELSQLFEYVDDIKTPKEKYIEAIEEENCLGKRSGSNRKITSSKMVILYGLNPDIYIFSALRFFWQKEIYSRPILALLCAVSRDKVLNISVPFIMNMDEGEVLNKDNLMDYIKNNLDKELSNSTLETTIRNIGSSWTQSGHLEGRIKKVRQNIVATPSTVAYALLLSHLAGVRGQAMFETEYFKLLDCNYESGLELAETAARRGWIIMKRLGNVIEINFPRFIN